MSKLEVTVGERVESSIRYDTILGFVIDTPIDEKTRVLVDWLTSLESEKGLDWTKVGDVIQSAMENEITVLFIPSKEDPDICYYDDCDGLVAGRDSDGDWVCEDHMEE